MRSASKKDRTQQDRGSRERVIDHHGEADMTAANTPLPTLDSLGARSASKLVRSNDFEEVPIFQTEKIHILLCLSPVSAKITLIPKFGATSPPSPNINVGGIGKVGQTTKRKDERFFRRSLHSQDQRVTSTLKSGEGGADRRNMSDERYFRQHR